MSATPYIGSSISLVSKALIRYEGKLYAVDLKESTVTLSNVRSFGTEDRCKDKVIPPRKEVYEYIVFRGQDIKDLNVYEGPGKQTAQQPQEDPAILSATVSSPGGVPYGAAPPPAPYQSPGVFSPFGGLPYSSYPVGYQPSSPQFPDRQAPLVGVRPPMPVGMTPGAPLLPRNPTPPIPGPGLSRNSTPSPSALLRSSESTVKTQETQTKNTSQQGTQTTKKKPSSRRNSTEKTQEKENKKPQETTQTEKAEEKPEQERKSSRENKPRGRRPQGRRGGYRGPRRDSRPKEFEDEFDFQSANAKFNKEEMEEEWHKKLGLALTLNDDVEVEGEEHSAAQSPEPTSYYDKGVSFFDSISCEAKDRDKNRRTHPSWAEERKLNTETFGHFGTRRGRGGYRGRGRGGYRGRGRGGYRGRGGRGGRGGGGRGVGTNGEERPGWVDYPLDADASKLQQNLPSGTTPSNQNQPAAQA